MPRQGLRWLVAALSLGLAVAAHSTDSLADSLEAQRLLYAEATAAGRAGNWAKFEQLRAQLDAYPLAIYLDFQYLEARLRVLPLDKARDFIAASANTPLQLRFKGRYLDQLGQGRRWKDFLALSPNVPVAVNLQCYYYRAQRTRGDRELAWRGARSLWLHGKSRPRACNPLFERWIAAGKIDDDAVWQRQLLAFQARRLGLVRYAGRKGSKQQQVPFSEALVSVYRYPSRVTSLELPTDDPRSLDVLAHGIMQLARVDINRALRDWKRLQQSWNFTAEQKQLAGDAIVRYTLLRKASRNLPWLDSYLEQRGDIELLEGRLRLAIQSSDWKAIMALSKLLPPARREAEVWLYWNAVAKSRTGDEDGARALFERAADKRSYYGFLAAEHLGREYQLNGQPLQVSLKQVPAALQPGVERTAELLHHTAIRNARSEWNYLLEMTDEEGRAALAQHANRQGWHDLAMGAVAEAKQWDALAVRFPQPYLDTFENYGKRYGVADTELISIARRESGFYSHAHSGAGARGLMQLLPTTAKLAARSLGQKALANDLYQVEANIALGGAYYRQLLDQHNGNRVLGLAAYNAGPLRVRQWLRKTKQRLDVQQWIEAIPFRETREYVQGVLAYNVVYDRLRGGQQAVFTREEGERRY